MPDPALLQLEGAPAERAFKKVPMATQNFFSGLVTQRSPFSSLDNRYNRKYLGGRPDQLLDGLNTEISNYATVIRRAGTSAFFTSSIPETSVNSFYSFHQLNGNISVMMDGAANIWTIDPTGGTLQFTKTTGAGQTYFQGVGNTLYMGDGVDQVAWTPGSPFRNWGISIASVQNTIGPNTATVASQASTGAQWTNPNNITTTSTSYATLTLPALQGGSVNTITLTGGGTFNSSGGVPAVSFTGGGGGSGAAAYITYQFVHNISGNGTIYQITGIVLTGGGGGYTSAPTVHISGSSGATATCTINSPSTLFTAAQSLQGTGFGFSLPNTENITGIQVTMKLTVTVAGSGTATASYPVQLLLNGLPSGNVQMVNVTADGAPHTVSLGGNSDLWGITINPSVVSLPNFGFQFTPSITNQSGPSFAFQVNSFEVTVYGLGGPLLTLVSGSLTTTNGGYQYVYAYGNPSSGHISNPTPASLSTGNFSSMNVEVALTASSDPQVTQIHVYRTKDGGSVYYELPTSPYPNTTGLITDSNPDSTLNTLIFWPTIPYVLNTPPPAGLGKLAYHLGRIWGAVNNYVFYSAGPDAVLGNGNESFPPANYFLFPSTVNRLVPYSSGLLVFTTDDVWIILGTSIATFYAVPFQTGVGLLSYNALDILGTNIFLYTSDRQFLSLSSAGFSEIGYPIGNLLEVNFDPAKVYVASIVQGTAEKAVYISDGADDWYRCNWNQSPEGGPAWSPIATIDSGAFALSSIETVPGKHQLLMGFTQFGQGMIGVKYRDLSGVYTDYGTGGTETPYDAYVTFGSLVLAQQLQLAEVDSILIENTMVGAIPLVSVLIDEISGPFENLPVSTNDPPELTPSLTVMSNRWYMAQGANCARMRHMQIKVDFGQDIAKNQLYTLSVAGGLEHHD